MRKLQARDAPLINPHGMRNYLAFRFQTLYANRAALPRAISPSL